MVFCLNHPQHGLHAQPRSSCREDSRVHPRWTEITAKSILVASGIRPTLLFIALTLFKVFIYPAARILPDRPLHSCRPQEADTEMFKSIGSHQPSLAQLSPFPCPAYLPLLQFYLPPRGLWWERRDERSSIKRTTAAKQSQAGVLKKSRHGRGNRHMASFCAGCIGSWTDFLQMCLILDKLF